MITSEHQFKNLLEGGSIFKTLKQLCQILGNTWVSSLKWEIVTDKEVLLSWLKVLHGILS